MMGKCCFCEEYRSPLASRYYMELGQKIGIASRILFETENWYAVPSLGCLTVGYILLVCKRHYLSAAALNSKLFQEMLELKGLAEKKIDEKLGLKCLAFEHGTTSALYSGANSVDHVHLHILPSAKEVWPDISSRHGLEGFITVGSYNDLYSLWTSSRPKTYLIFQDLDQTIHYKPDAGGMPSQFFRKCLAPYFKADEWNWKEELYPENLMKTIQLFG